MKKLIVFLIAMMPGYAFGQRPLFEGDAQGFLISGGYFFAALVAGTLLALGFQYILTNLGVSIGISASGPIYEKKVEPKNEKEEHKTLPEKARTFSNAFGVFALITTSISLFFASWFAVQLSLTTSALLGIIIGLSVWGSFYLIVMSIEAGAATIMMRSLSNLAGSGMKAAYESSVALMGRTSEKQIADSAEKIAHAVREEFLGDIKGEKVLKEMRQYFDTLQRQRITPEDIRREVTQLLNETEIRAVAQYQGPMMDRQEIVATLQSKSGMSREKAESVYENVDRAVNVLKEERVSEKEPVGKLADTALRATGMSGEQAQEFRTKIESYLRSTGKEELNPEGIKRDLEKMITDPRGGTNALRSRLAAIDKSTIVSLLSQREDISRDEANKIVDSIDKVVSQVSSKVGGTAQETKSPVDSAIQKLHNYLDSLGRGELDYEGIKEDMQLLFHDPSAGIDALQMRLEAMDRDTIKAVLSSRRDISEEDAERIVSKVEEARDNVLEKSRQMTNEVKRRVDHVKQEAYHNAEETRKTIANASWWAFVTVLISGVLAAIGGFVAAV